MVNINLFPWREAEAQYQKKILNKIMIVILGAAVIINLIFHLLLIQEENKIRKRIGSMNEEIKNFSAVKNREPLRKDFWKGFFSGKTGMKGACFNVIEESDKGVMFAGRARSVNDLTLFLKQWEVVGFFSEMKIKLIEEDGRGVKFVLEGKRG